MTNNRKDSTTNDLLPKMLAKLDAIGQAIPATNNNSDNNNNWNNGGNGGRTRCGSIMTDLWRHCPTTLQHRRFLADFCRRFAQLLTLAV